jgi:hypothetical protein
MAGKGLHAAIYTYGTPLKLIFNNPSIDATIGGTPTDGNSFENCTHGVYSLYKGNLSITNNTLTAISKKGVFVNQNNTNVTIDQNKFNQCFVGVHLHDNGAIKADITNNQFVNTSPVGTYNTNFSIITSEVVAPTAASIGRYYNIFNNHIDGYYNGIYTAYSALDSTGGPLAINNVSKRNFAVTSNMYSTDGIGIHPSENLLVTSLGSDSFGEPQDTYLANYYSLKATNNLISGFEIGLASSSQPGATLQISIVDTTTFFENATTSIQDNNGYPAVSDGEIVITAADITAGKIGIAFPQPISLPAGSYMAVVKTSSTLGNRVRILDDLTVPQPGVASMVNTLSDAGTPTSYGNGTAFAIRLKMGDQMSVDELASTFGLSVYPNPASADATVAFDVKNAASVAIQVTDLAGKVVYTSALANVNGAQNVVIPAQEFANGMYTVSINVDGAIATKKLNVRK